MQRYNAINGQSFSDVCLNTYGSLDNYVRMLNDNGLVPDNYPFSGQQISWDPEIVVDQTIYKKTTGAGVVFATLVGINGNNFFQTVGGENPKVLSINPAPISQGGTTPPTPSNMYTKTKETQFVSVVGGETSVTLVELEGKEIVSVVKELKTLLKTQYIVGPAAGEIQLSGVDPLAPGETLFIYYNETINP